MINLKFQAQKEKKIITMYFVIGIITIFLVLLAIFFSKNILTHQFKAAEKYMEQSVFQTASNLKGRIENSINEMRILAAKLPDSAPSYSEDEITKFLTHHVTDYDYRRLVFAYKNGRTIRVQENVGRLESADWSSEPRFVKAITGEEAFVTTKEEPSVPSGYVNEFGVPVYDHNNQIIGVLGSQIYAQNYLKILGFNNYNQKGFSYIINSSGDYIIKPTRDKNEYKNIFEANIQFSAKEKEVFQNMLKTQDSGTFICRINGKKYIASFAEINNSDRFVFTIVPMNVIMLDVDKLLFGIAMIVIIVSGLLLLLLWYSKRVFRDHERTIYEIAFKDDVTGGGNKNKFKLAAKDILSADKNNNYAIISIDLTKFKAINELYGVEKADKILKDVYKIICENLKKDCFCTRDYAASFVVLYKYDKEDFIVKYFIQKLIDEIAIYNDTKMKELSSEQEAMVSAKLSLSFGIYLVNNKEESIDQMCERAYIAKRNIKDDIMNIYKFYDDAMSAQILQDKSIEAEMHYALSDNQFQMFLQPKFFFDYTEEIAGAEALVRWIHPQKGMMPPMQFIPLFEKNGFILELDRCIWKQACEFLAERKKAGDKLFPISVNVSRLHMNNDAFITDLVALTRKYDVDPKYLELELTETACFNNEVQFERVVKSLKEYGFTIAMDDFGTGYSSLNMLRHLPIDVLKLDRGFIKDTIADKKGQIVTKSIIDMANKLNMVTVAEGIEFEEQAEFLRSIGCKIAQGFLYGKPVSTEVFINSFLAIDKII